MQKNIGTTIDLTNPRNGHLSNDSDSRSEPFELYDLELLKDPAEAQAYLDAELKEGDPYYILKALNKIAKANGGFSELARKTGLSRENLYTALSPDGNPRFDSITKILHSLGLRMSVEPLKPVRKTRAKLLPKTSKPKLHSRSTSKRSLSNSP
jgi:probable addiction module antidote protein